jgi:hypothetical protein
MADELAPDVQPVGDVEDPETVVTGDQGASDNEKSDIELLAEDDKEPEKEPKVEDKKDEKAGEEEEDDEAEKKPVDEEKEQKKAEAKEKEENEDKEAEKEDNPLPGRPSYRELKTEFPTIFRKFPGLRDAIFREQRYAETFPTVEEAQSAATKAENFDLLAAGLTQGDPELLLKELNTGDKDAFVKVAQNFLPELQKLDRDAYVKATFPVLEDLIRAAYNDGKATNDKNLMYAAGHLAKFVFGEAKIPEPRAKTGPHPAEVQLQEERNAHFQQRYQAFSREVNTEDQAELEKMASTGIPDPEKKLSAYVRKAIVRDSITELDEALLKDERLKNTLKTLWKSAANGGFTREHKASILNAHLARARQLLPGIRNKLVVEALATAAPKPGVTAAPQPDKKAEKRVLPDGGGGGKSGVPRQYAAKDVDWSKTSDLDILNDRPTLRKR